MAKTDKSEIPNPKSEMRFSVLTWGCQMNEDDSRQISNLIEQTGYRPTEDVSDADIVMLNTCSVREKPEQKVRSKLGELRLLKLEKPSLIIGVCGCMAQRDGLALRKSMPFIDLVIGTASIPELPMLIEEVRRTRRFASALKLPNRNGKPKPVSIPRLVGKVGLKMFVPVMYGCDNFCTYCVVPHVRGPERSRPAEEIVAEVEALVSKGCREVTLVGQNVNSYAGESGRVSEGARGEHEVSHSPTLPLPHSDFAELLDRIDDIAGLERIRFTTSHPKDLSDRLITAIAEFPKVCEHLHLPMQSGDNDVLRRMGRGYTIEHYIDLVDNLRIRVPGITITTDILIGFPGETGAQFRNTLDALEAIRFDGAFMFAFNPRPGTAAAEMDGQVENRIKTRRLVELIAVQNGFTLETNQERVGQVFEVLAEGPSERDPSRMSGYTRHNKTMNFKAGADVTGKLILVRAEKAHPWGFSGEIL